jgi:thiamine-monophosphate kinase
MQTVRALGEVPLIARLRRRLETGYDQGASGQSTVLVGLGDDAAVLRAPTGRWRWLFASDMLVEGVHFRRRVVPAWQIGWKALACNVSDIAAMGGTPRWAVVSLGLPPETPVPFVDGLYDGLMRCARRYGVAIVGGDTVRAPQVVVDVAIMGTARPSQLVLRSGARVGDLLYVTGRLGGSYRSGRHARVAPRVDEARALVQRLHVHAMIDLSDGLASDLWQMSRASRVALRVEASKIPVSRAGRTVRHALMDGEDFELLFAVAPRDAPRVPTRIGSCPVTRIGRAVGRGVRVELQRADGHIEPLVPTGFQHFAHG